ncbi:UNVERIFIED_CONTAM: hypothetical protein GTU68_059876, partial [Idotea baltica]|nr:hypothetical protein [Idotea baltica]
PATDPVTVPATDPATDPSSQADCSCGIDNSLARIVGGTEADENEYPWLAQLITTGRSSYFFCGGSLISPEYVLTAAHCVQGDRPNDIQVVLGSHDRSESETSSITVDVEEIIVHESYNSRTYVNDIALIKLSDPVTFTEEISPVCLPFSYQSLDITGETATASGWGTLEENGRTSSVLMKVDVPLISRADCGATTDYSSSSIKAGMLCAGENGKDACQGDSGGPLVWENADGYNILLGATSWGVGCARDGYPGVYTDVRSYTSWITDETQESFCVV